MTRLVLLLGILAACARPGADPGSAHRSLHVWIDTWLEARHCLLGDAPDTRTGVLISELTGRDCSRPLHQLALQVPTGEVALDHAWRGVIDRLEPVATASMIDDLDAGARALGLAIGRWVVPRAAAPLPHLPDPAPMFGGVQVIDAELNGGFAYAFQVQPEGSNTLAVGVDRHGNRLRYPQRFPPIRPEPLAEISDGAQTLLVWRRPEAAFAYAIDVTARGVTRTTYVPGKLGYLAQDPRTGEIVIHIEQAGEHFLHRILPGASSATVSPAQALGNHSYGARCIQGGEAWGLADGVAVHVTEQEHWPKVLGEISREMTVDCRGASAIVLRHDPDVLERCGEGGCVEVFAAPTGRAGVAALLDDGRWIYAAHREGIVAIWVEEGGAPRVYRVHGDKLAGVTVDEGIPALVFEHEGRYGSVMLPADAAAGTARLARTQP